MEFDSGYVQIEDVNIDEIHPILLFLTLAKKEKEKDGFL
jgi:hypothetical protein